LASYGVFFYIILEFESTHSMGYLCVKCLSISGEHFKEEFTKLTPWQKVPVLDDNGFVLTER